MHIRVYFMKPKLSIVSETESNAVVEWYMKTNVHKI